MDEKEEEQLDFDLRASAASDNPVAFLAFLNQLGLRFDQQFIHSKYPIEYAI